MNGLILTGAILASCLVVSDATIIFAAPAAAAVATVAVGPALASLAILKAAAIKGLIVGSFLAGGRGKRSTTDLETLLLSASQKDSTDCAKKLVCEVNGLSPAVLQSEEAMIARLFNANSLDLSKATVEFDLAAQIGKRVGKEQCSIIYERCPHDRQKLVQIFRSPNLVQ
ncbi:Uncharacterized protein FKW44_011545 [Caligus rogercresseyi]|uniref:Uncharacterized protein n=1 Tax=Caligus rogercresseyi TaxID=217165 RepID=A0A7T8HIS8_CALRO|nr:Uncharacterized protein FKW44_011545 [Caligus rogercresseyi]|eukprot:TRINITY_DN10731_c0_g1_i1.p1 TRINITY_DN10731_c0_g1~~TRINITY_DN10731_c0_g1_i1.p1  ORF type:complete len:170 (-),score=40.21 TRINITY_DN10731_c0_g1_i1:180-689(-)